MTVPDRDLDDFIERKLPSEDQSQGRLGTILGTQDEGEAVSGWVVLLERVGRAYHLTPDEFDLLD